jgi:hypothetical protein
VTALTAPYWAHFLWSLPWYVGRKGWTAWMIDPIVLPCALIGLVAALRRPTQNVFLGAWAAAPMAWLVQDPTRFTLHWPLVGSVLGGTVLARLLERRDAVVRSAATVVVVLVASLPGLGGETMWLLARSPRMLDWDEMRADAALLGDRASHDRPVLGFGSWIGSAIAVWQDIQVEKGHWIEVRPRVDPAESLGVGDKLYVVAIPPDGGLLTAGPHGAGFGCTAADGGLRCSTSRVSRVPTVRRWPCERRGRGRPGGSQTGASRTPWVIPSR